MSGAFFACGQAHSTPSDVPRKSASNEGGKGSAFEGGYGAAVGWSNHAAMRASHRAWLVGSSPWQVSVSYRA